MNYPRFPRGCLCIAVSLLVWNCLTARGQAPVVISPGVAAVSDTAAELSANVLPGNDSPVTERGAVLSIAGVNANPLIGGADVTKITIPGDPGAFTVNAGDLAGGTTYAMKAFASTAAGVGYTQTVIFTTTGGAPPARLVTTDVDEFDTPSGSHVSLREAVRDAANSDVIGFAPELNGRVIVLTRGQVTVADKAVTIDASRLLRGIVLDGRKASRHILVESGAALALNKVTLQRGRPAAAGESGGSILGTGALTLTDCTFRDNAAADGENGRDGLNGRPPSTPGGLDYLTPLPGTSGTAGGGGGAISWGGNVTAVRCRFLNNAAGHGGSGGTGGSIADPSVMTGACGGQGAAAGGGGAVASNGLLTLTDCLFQKNRAGAGGSGGNVGGGGGGFSNICFDSFSGAAGNSGRGGAVQHSGSLAATGCTFTGNACVSGGFGGNRSSFGGVYGQGGLAGAGGGLACDGGAIFLSNCTLSENSMEDGFQSGDGGAAISCGGGAGTTLNLMHCTITANKGTVVRTGVSGWGVPGGAGVFSRSPVQCTNCLIAGNRVQRGAFPYEWREENFAGSGARTITPATPFPDYSAGGPPAVDPLVSPLTVSGGSLPAYLLLPASPALHGGGAAEGVPSLDQRGFPRPVSAPDLGAVEMQSTEPGALPPQSLTLSTPDSLQYGGTPLNLNLSATTSAGLPAVFEVISGPGSLNGNTLVVTSPGWIAVRASHPGNASWAPAPDHIRVIEITRMMQSIPFSPPAQYYMFDKPVSVTLPANSSAGLPITWSLPPGSASTVDGNVLTAGSGSLVLTGSVPGNQLYEPFTKSWTLNVISVRPEFSNSSGLNLHLAEGSNATISLRATIPVPHTEPIPLAPWAYWLGTELEAVTPAIIPAGSTSVTFQVKALDDDEVEGTQTIQISKDGTAFAIIALVEITDNDSAYLRVQYPRWFLAGAPARITVTAAATAGNPVPSLAGRTLAVSATLNSTEQDMGVTPATVGPVADGVSAVEMMISIPASTPNGVAGRLRISTPGLTLLPEAQMFFVVTREDSDRDGLDNVMEAGLQLSSTNHDPPPLVMESRPDGTVHAVLGRLPGELFGWKVQIQISAGLTQWAVAPAANTTITGGNFGRMSVLMPSGARFARILVTMPE